MLLLKEKKQVNRSANLIDTENMTVPMKKDGCYLDKHKSFADDLPIGIGTLDREKVMNRIKNRE